MVRARDDGGPEPEPRRGLERERPRPKLVRLALHPDDVPAREGAGFVLGPPVERDPDEEEDVGLHDRRGAGRAERAERKAGDDEGTLGVPFPEVPDGGDEVARLAAAVVEAPLGGADPPEVESKGGEVEAVGQEPRGPVDGLRVHRTAEQRVRVRDDGGSDGSRRQPKQPLEGSGGPGKRQGEHSDGGHGHPKLACAEMTEPGGPGPRSRASRFEPWISLLLVLLAASLAIHHLSEDAATADEPVHLAAAVEIAREGTGRWNPEHPPLAKALAGFALTGLPLRPADDPFRSPAGPARLLRFLYANETPAETILFRARLPFVGLLAAVLLAVRAEARRRWGAWAGCAALAFAALEPNLNAHAGVVHTDVAVTLFVVLSVRPLSQLVRPEARRAAPLLGLLWGLALLSKYSAPLLALCTLPFLAAETTPGRGDVVRLLRRLAAAAGIALLVTLAGFAWAYRGQSAEDRRALAVDRLETKGRSPAAARLALAAGDALPPLGNLLTGSVSVALQSEVGAGVNYFLGRVSREGSPWYFPVALAVKAPLGLLLGLAAALAVRGSRRFAAALGAGLLLFLLLSSRTTYNIGVRHALFLFPLAAITAGAALAASASRLPRAAALGALFVGAVEIGTVHPHQLSFFNALAGGPEGGRRFFVDSNLDWGQDLLRLKEAAPGLAPAGLPTVVFGGDLPARHAPVLRPPFPGEEDRPGTILALGEAPFALGPELLRSKGAAADADRLERIRTALRERGTRIGSIGGSIGLWRIDR